MPRRSEAQGMAIVSGTTRTVAFASSCLVLALSACQDRQITRANVVVRDSAGIQIVENDRPQQDSSASWVLAQEPSVVIGSADGEGAQSFYRILHAIQLGDRAIAVVDGSSQEIRVFDEAGGHVRTYGGKGGGPGRFQGLATVLASGDSLVAFDRRTRSITVFSLSADDVRTVQVADPEQRGGLSLAGRLPDGAFLTHSGGSPIRENLEGVIQTPEWIARWDPTSGTVADIVEMPGPEMVALDAGAGLFIMSRPFGRQSFYCTRGDRIIEGYTEFYDLRYHDVDGGLLRIARKSAQPVGITDDDQRAYREGPQIYVGGHPVSDALTDADFPPTKPTSSGLVCDAEGNVWVRGYRLPGETSPENWSVFDEAGVWITDVRTPSAFSVTEVGPDYVLGIRRDESDVEYVVKYALVK